MMTWAIIGAVLGGMFAGRYFLPSGMLPVLNELTSYALALMLFGVGVGVGRNRKELEKLRSLGWRVLLVPVAVMGGTFAGVALAQPIFGMPLKEVLAVGAGFGWYTLSSVIISQMHSVELGAVAFLANVFRELLAFLIVPTLVAWLGRIVALAPGGATTMDSTLPMIAKLTDPATVLIGFLNGVILSTLVPFLVPLILSAGF